MSIKLYHQVGHNSNWNIDSFLHDDCGDGLILSPVHQPKKAIEDLSDSIKNHSIFDPQYYLPNSQKRKLSTYPFFPEVISGGFSTSDFYSIAHQSAESCIQFQIDQGFEKLIIPTRYIDQMNSDFIQRQEDYTLKPFLKVINSKGINTPIYATLALTSHMIQDVGFRNMLLNWITSFPEISGIYLLVSHERETKQIQSEAFLSSYLEFLNIFRLIDLEVIVGHTNTESLILSLVDDITVTFGSFENTRMFSIDKFVDSNEERRGPKARIYLPKLLNWIQYGQALEIRQNHPKLWSDIYTPTRYADEVLATTLEPTFNQAGLYKHHFTCLNQQIKELDAETPVSRHKLLSSWINNAIQYYYAISTQRIPIELHGNDRHLPVWKKVVDNYYKTYLVR